MKVMNLSNNELSHKDYLHIILSLNLKIQVPINIFHMVSNNHINF